MGVQGGLNEIANGDVAAGTYTLLTSLLPLTNAHSREALFTRPSFMKGSNYAEPLDLVACGEGDRCFVAGTQILRAGAGGATLAVAGLARPPRRTSPPRGFGRLPARRAS